VLVSTLELKVFDIELFVQVKCAEAVAFLVTITFPKEDVGKLK